MEVHAKWYALFVILPMVGGLVACSGLIVRNAPTAKELFNRILPYKALVGVALLVSFFWNMIEMGFNPFAAFKFSSLSGAMVLMNLVTHLLLGFTMAAGQIIKWIPGDSAPEEKAAELQRKLMPFEATFGLVIIASGILGLLWTVKPSIFL